MPLNAAMANGPIVRVVTATAILAILQIGLADAAYRDDEDFSSPEDDIRDRSYISPSKTCKDKYEIKTKKIIRTEDSLSNDAVFLNAVITENHQDCLRTCCGYEEGTCDTTIYIQGDGGSDENCFLFRCWFDDEQRCLFSSHDGYVISMMGGFENPRFSQNTDETHLVPPEHYNSDPVSVSSEEHDVAISPKKTTISPSTTTKTHFSTPATDVKTYKKPTNAPKRPVDEQVCTSMQYKCPMSRECILKRLLCDKIVDCIDGSDEHDCEPESQDPVKDESQQIPSSHSVVTMAPPESLQHKDGFQGNGIDSTLPPNPPPPTHLAESSQNDHQDKGDSKPKAKGPAIDSVSRDRAGQVEIPTGALFPLVVGLLLTMFLVMMVGCRLRYMNRRLRYGRMKTNAHDADYLINGMYL